MRDRHVFRNVLLLVLLTLLNVCRNFLWLTPSALMTPIMEELHLNYTQSGYMLMIVTVMMGVFLIAGSFLLSHISPPAAMMIGLLCLAADGGISFASSSFAVIMVGRVLSGIGYGLTTCATMALIAASFPPERLGWINGIHACISSVTINMAYRFIVPISDALGSWKREACLFAVLSVATAVCFFLWMNLCGRGLSYHGDDPDARRGTIGQAMRFPIIRHFVVIIGCTMLIYVYFSSYYPNFLHQAHDFSLAESSTLAGYMSIAGIVGSLGMGAIYERIRHQKAVTLLIVAVLILSFFGMTQLTFVPLLIPAICLFGAGFTALSTLFATSIMRLPGITPLAASAGISVMNAGGSLLALVVPRIQDALATQLGLTMALTCFGVLFVPALISALGLPRVFVKSREG